MLSPGVSCGRGRNPEIAAGDPGNDATPVAKQGTTLKVCITRMSVGGEVRWDILQEIAPTKTHNQ